MPCYLRVLVVAAIAASTGAGTPASARTHVVLGVGVGVPVYAPPPVYYSPPPMVYVPPPPVVVYSPPAPVMVRPAPPPPQTGNCRLYRGDATIDGQNRPFFGTACLQPDGKWHVVN